MKHLQLTDELQEKASIYAAGAMPEDERREYMRHLEEDGCTVCTGEVRELQSTASLFGFSLPLETPSETVKSRLMAQAEAAAQRPSARPRPWVVWTRILYELAGAAAFILLFVVIRENSEL